MSHKTGKDAENPLPSWLRILGGVLIALFIFWILMPKTHSTGQAQVRMLTPEQAPGRFMWQFCWDKNAASIGRGMLPRIDGKCYTAVEVTRLDNSYMSFLFHYRQNSYPKISYLNWNLGKKYGIWTQEDPKKDATWEMKRVSSGVYYGQYNDPGHKETGKISLTAIRRR